MFLSDNGPDASVVGVKAMYDHLQAALDIHSGSVELRGRKNLNYEAGHRVPLLWRWPARWQPRVVDDPTIPVSYVDIYRTLADIIGADLPCNEAPDSRSLLTLLDGVEPTDQLKRSKILTHAKKGARIAFRQRNMKWIPEYNELYNLKNDIEEKVNLMHFERGAAIGREMNNTMNEIVQFITHREEVTQKGKLDNCPKSRYLMG